MIRDLKCHKHYVYCVQYFDVKYNYFNLHFYLERVLILNVKLLRLPCIINRHLFLYVIYDSEVQITDTMTPHENVCFVR